MENIFSEKALNRDGEDCDKQKENLKQIPD